jgi:two-component system sensor histidine kinase MtrB
MELSRFDAHAEQADLEPLDLGAAVRAIVAVRLPSAAVALPARPVVVEADVRRLDRIVGNLLDNARDHAPDSIVEVAVLDDGAWTRVTVSDRGPGVAAESLGSLFERFFKADASRHGGSSGLGLAIASEHAELLGGTLTAENRAEGGLVVTLRLPVTGSLPGREAADTDEREPDVGSIATTASTEGARPNP